MYHYYYYMLVLCNILNMNCYGYYVFFADDLDISPDFFEYFAATYPILVADPTLWCVSAWNDNGKGNMVGDEPGKNITKLFLYPTV